MNKALKLLIILSKPSELKKEISGLIEILVKTEEKVKSNYLLCVESLMKRLSLIERINHINDYKIISYNFNKNEMIRKTILGKLIINILGDVISKVRFIEDSNNIKNKEGDIIISEPVIKEKLSKVEVSFYYFTPIFKEGVWSNRVSKWLDSLNKNKKLMNLNDKKLMELNKELEGNILRNIKVRRNNLLNNNNIIEDNSNNHVFNIMVNWVEKLLGKLSNNKIFNFGIKDVKIRAKLLKYEFNDPTILSKLVGKTITKKNRWISFMLGFKLKQRIPVFDYKEILLSKELFNWNRNIKLNENMEKLYDEISLDNNNHIELVNGLFNNVLSWRNGMDSKNLNSSLIYKDMIGWSLLWKGKKDSSKTRAQKTILSVGTFMNGNLLIKDILNVGKYTAHSHDRLTLNNIGNNISLNKRTGADTIMMSLI